MGSVEEEVGEGEEAKAIVFERDATVARTEEASFS